MPEFNENDAMDFAEDMLHENHTGRFNKQKIQLLHYMYSDNTKLGGCKWLIQHFFQLLNVAFQGRVEIPRSNLSSLF